jgi:hypothetical protein
VVSYCDPASKHFPSRLQHKSANHFIPPYPFTNNINGWFISVVLYCPLWAEVANKEANCCFLRAKGYEDGIAQKTESLPILIFMAKIG